jgi:DNA-binding response OmpR family regulator
MPYRTWYAPIGMALTLTNLLLVEDDYVTAFSMRQRLEGAGFRVVGVAANAASALRLAEHEAVQLALIALPRKGAQEGIAIARALRTHHGVPSLFVTAHAKVAKTAEDAAVGFLEKPFSGITLLETIHVLAAHFAGEAIGAIPSGLHLFAHKADQESGA